jgi:hypothetical protein
MNRTHEIILGIFILIWGIWSIYSGIKGKSLTHVMSPSDTFLSRKILGEKGSSIWWNLFWGVVEIIFGVLFLIGKI